MLRKLIRTQSDRGRERWRRAGLSAVVALASRFGNIAALFITMPMMREYLGPERFGMWMVVSSLATLMTFADFGIGNGVVTLVAAASGDDDHHDPVRAIVSSGFVSLILLAVPFAATALILPGLTSSDALFNVHSTLARAEAGPIVATILLSIAVGLPAGLASKTQIALQDGYQANAWMGLGSLLSFGLILAGIRFDVGLPALVAALFGAPQLVLLANSLVYFGWQRRDLTPRIALAQGRIARQILHLGAGFFALQAVAAITYRVDSLIVMQKFGAAQAGDYAVYERIFSLSTMLMTIALSPLWPAYSEAIRRGDLVWVKRTLIWSTLGAIAVVGAATGLIALIHDPLLRLWFGHTIPAGGLLLTGFVVWKCIESAGYPASLYLNGSGLIRPQVWASVAMAAIALTLKLVLAPRLGIWSILWITSATYVVTSAIPLAMVIVRNIRRQEEGAVPC